MDIGNVIVEDYQNDLEIIQTGTNEYIFTRLMKTEYADDKDFNDESGSGTYVMYKTSGINGVTLLKRSISTLWNTLIEVLIIK